MSELRIGLVGPGAIGETHARAIERVEGACLVAVAGGTAGQAGALAAGATLAHYPTAAAMLAEAGLDAAVICTPSGSHGDSVRAALAAGLAVLVEKPLCVDAAEAAGLVRAAEASGHTCGVVSQRRLEPQHAAIKRLLSAGALGEPRLIEAAVHWYRSDAYYAEKPWRGDPVHGGGSLFNQGIHNLDLMLWLFGPADSVQAMAGRLGHSVAVEDVTSAILRFASGAFGSIVTSTALPPGRPATLRIFTDRGSCELAHDAITRWDFPDVPRPEDGGGPASGASDPKAIGDAGHIAQWRDFVAAIRERRPPLIPFRDGFEAVRTVVAIYRSASEKRAVALSEFPLETDR